MPRGPARQLTVRRLGLTGYHEVHALQRELQEERRTGRGEDVLLVTEHPPVLTLGRGHTTPDLRVGEAEIRKRGIEIVQTERGGDITYHGPGQLVVYGVINLRGWGVGALDYVAALEDAAVAALARWGLAAGRSPLGRGVWLDGRKVASVGVNVRGGVSMHGIALNVATDLGPFALINPCGLAGVEMTSIADALGRPVSLDDVAASFIDEFARIFGARLITRAPGARQPA